MPLLLELAESFACATIKAALSLAEIIESAYQTLLQTGRWAIEDVSYRASIHVTPSVAASSGSAGSDAMDWLLPPMTQLENVSFDFKVYHLCIFSLE